MGRTSRAATWAAETAHPMYRNHRGTACLDQGHDIIHLHTHRFTGDSGGGAAAKGGIHIIACCISLHVACCQPVVEPHRMPAQALTQAM